MSRFPFNAVPADSRIIIYGAGHIGRDYWLQVDMIDYCVVLFFVDVRYSEIQWRTPAIEVRSPDSILGANYDYIIIATASAKNRQEILDYLARMNIPQDKILAPKCEIPGSRIDSPFNEMALTYRISSAELHEDVVLYELLNHITIGFYIDAGCADPDEDSVTKIFYKLGWTGINIDPRHEVIEKFQQKRMRDINCCLAVSNKIAEIPFWSFGNVSTCDRDTALRLSEEHGLKFTETSINTMPLNFLLERHCMQKEIHFLKIDVEMHEKQVLEGIDLTRYRPWVIVVESTRPLTYIPTHGEWERYLFDGCYRYFTTDGVNRYYIAAERWEELTRRRENWKPTLFLLDRHKKYFEVNT